mmetsp:Transcript_105802/g.304044  ORF Transcript_105802/g.304044 Transcript_105802/m.304044 type:complete len:84 (-) Transcript_105802:48-299(-)
MKDMLIAAGFGNIKIEVKEAAGDIIKDWMPGSGAEKFVTSVYVTATKPVESYGLRDHVQGGTQYVELSAVCAPPAASGCGPGV